MSLGASEAVCFSQHRHYVDLLMKCLHELYINWPETATTEGHQDLINISF